MKKNKEKIMEENKLMEENKYKLKEIEKIIEETARSLRRMLGLKYKLGKTTEVRIKQYKDDIPALISSLDLIISDEFKWRVD